MLAAAGVLKFVYEQMVDSVGDRDGSIGWRSVGVAEDGLRNLGNLSEVDQGILGKDDLELGSGMA
jgi:hypothetical protein